jgi:galactose mutarotase-like enzyme
VNVSGPSSLDAGRCRTARIARAKHGAGPKRGSMEERDTWTCATDRVAITVYAQGAELHSIRHAQFGEVLWQAGDIWPQHAPNLFPIVGQLGGDTLRSGAATYHLPRHGFARRRRFTWTANDAAGCTLELRDDAQTREQYPYAFRLEIRYALAGDRLSITYRIENPSAVAVLPASVGAHPAFRWPLVRGDAKDDHTLTFAQPEPAPIRRLTNGLLATQPFPTPVQGRILHLREALFADDAIVMDRVASCSVRYSAPEAPAIDVAWDGFEQLGIWSKPGGDFVCIEPWYGYASPVDFDGPFETKPGLLSIAPGAARELTLHVRVSAGVGAVR